jgi:hypothetical protein
MSADSAYVDVTVTIYDATNTALTPIVQRITYSLSRVGARGQGQVFGVCFKRSATALTTAPTGGLFTAPTATGWSDGVPAGTDQLYMSSRLFTSDGLPPQQNTWSIPAAISKDGITGNGTKLQFSVNNVDWHDTPDTNDIYMRTGTSVAGGAYTYSGSVKIKGEQGPIGVGVKGDTGDSAVRIYKVVPIGTADLSAPGTGTAYPPDATWSITPQYVGTNYKQYQCDGLKNNVSNIITWGTPYLSVFKVDTLAAFTVNTGALSVSGNLSVSTAGSISSGATTYAGNSGYFLGFSGSTPVMSILNSSGKGLVFNGSDVILSGSLSAATGSFAGSLMVGGTAYSTDSFLNANTTATQVGLGNVSNLTPVNQTATGLTTGTTITGGGITFSSGGTLKGGKTSFADTSNAGFILGYGAGISANQYGFKFGTADMSKGISWDGSTLSVKGDITGSTGSFSGTLVVGSTAYNIDSFLNSNTTATQVGLGNVSNLTPANQTATGLNSGTTITAGGITFSSGGTLKGGKTSFTDASSAGFILGYGAGGSANQYGFKFGNADMSRGIYWDGSALSVSGDITANSFNGTGVVSTNNIAALSVTEATSYSFAKYLTHPANSAGSAATTDILTGMSAPAVNTATERFVLVNMQFDHADSNPGYFRVKLGTDTRTCDAPIRILDGSNISSWCFLYKLNVSANVTAVPALSIELVNSSGTGNYWNAATTPLVSGHVLIFTGKR